MSKFKANTDDNFGVAEIMGIVLGRVENIVGKGENAGYQHFLLFPCFQKATFSGSLKIRIVWQRVKLVIVSKCLWAWMIVLKLDSKSIWLEAEYSSCQIVLIHPHIIE